MRYPVRRPGVSTLTLRERNPVFALISLLDLSHIETVLLTVSRTFRCTRGRL